MHAFLRTLRFTVIVALLLSSVAAVGGHARAAFASPGTSVTRLADGVVSVSSTAARYRATLRLLKALHVAVITSTGKTLIRPGKGSPHHFYLYDFEVREIAAALGRKDRRSLADLAQMLSALGLKPNGQALDAEILRSVLIQGTRDAESAPADPLSQVALAVRELGLHRVDGYDLAQDVPAEKLQFDALQTFLITADILTPLAQQSASNARALRFESVPLEACDSAGTDFVKEVTPFGKWGLGLIKALSPALKGVAMTMDAIHGPILAFGIKVTAASPELQSTHYGPPGHAVDAGKVLRFTVKVEMQDDLGRLVKCGALVGMKFPKQGPVSGVTIMWNQAESSLEDHGTISYDPADRKTGKDGTASLVFTPKNEVFPGAGIEKDARGALDGIALYQSAFGNVPGSLAQFLVPKYAGMAWEVKFHDPHLALDVDATYTAEATVGESTVQTSGHVQVNDLLLTSDGNSQTLSGSKQIEYVEFNASGGNATCTVTSKGTTLGDPFSARLDSPASGSTSSAPNSASPAKLRLVVQPGTAKEHVDVSCPAGHYEYVFPYTQFAGLWDSAHGIGNTFTDWTIQGGSTYAIYKSGTKSFNTGGGVFTVNVTLTLRSTEH